LPTKILRDRPLGSDFTGHLAQKKAQFGRGDDGRRLWFLVMAGMSPAMTQKRGGKKLNA
jgi:hypothetical protein